MKPTKQDETMVAADNAVVQPASTTSKRRKTKVSRDTTKPNRSTKYQSPDAKRTAGRKAEDLAAGITRREYRLLSDHVDAADRLLREKGYLAPFRLAIRRQSRHFAASPTTGRSVDEFSIGQAETASLLASGADQAAAQTAIGPESGRPVAENDVAPTIHLSGIICQADAEADGEQLSLFSA